MSIERYLSSPEWEKKDGEIIAIIMHGGGTSRWNARARVTLALQQHVSAVYSVLLPYHGSNSLEAYPRECRHDDLIQQGIDRIRDSLAPIVAGKKCVFLGMSFGALHLIRCFRMLYSTMNRESVFIGIGSMLVPSVNETKFIYQWWQGTRDDPEREPERESMRKLHPNIENMLSFIVDGAARTDSPIYHTNEEVEKMKNEKCFKNMFFIHGRGDEPYPLKRLEPIISADHLTIIEECGHFGYFNPHVGWPQVENAIHKIVNEHLTGQKQSINQSNNQSNNQSINQSTKSSISSKL